MESSTIKLSMLVLVHGGAVVGGKFFIPSSKWETLLSDYTSLLCGTRETLAEKVALYDGDIIGKLIRSGGRTKNSACAVIPESKVVEYVGQDLADFIKKHRAVISGSYATLLASKELGIPMTFVPSDIDVFCDSSITAPANDLGKFEITSHMTNAEYLDTNCKSIIKIIHNGTCAGKKVQFVMMNGIERINGIQDFARLVSNSIDFTVASSVLYYHENNFCLYVPNIADLVNKHLVQNPYTWTRESRLNKWTARGYTLRGNPVYREKREPCHETVLDQVGGTHTPTKTTSYAFCRDMEITMPGRVALYFTSCKNIHVTSLTNDSEIHSENSEIRISGVGGMVYGYGGSLENSGMSGWLFTFPEIADRSENWYPMPDHSQKMELKGEFYEADEGLFASKPLPAFPRNHGAIYAGPLGDLFESPFAGEHINDTRLWKSPDYKFCFFFSDEQIKEMGAEYLEFFNYSLKAFNTLFGMYDYTSMLADLPFDLDGELNETIRIACKYLIEHGKVLVPKASNARLTDLVRSLMTKRDAVRSATIVRDATE